MIIINHNHIIVVVIIIISCSLQESKDSLHCTRLIHVPEDNPNISALDVHHNRWKGHPRIDRKRNMQDDA